MGFFHSLNKVFPFACSQLLWNTSEWDLLKYLWSGCWRTCGLEVHLQLRVAILGCPTFLPWSPLGYMDLPAEWAQDIKQLFCNVFDYTVIAGNHKYTHKNHPQSGKTNYSNMLDYFSSPCALQVNLFCSVLLWLSFVLMHILDYLNSLALICLCILFSLLLLRYLCNSHYQQGFTFGYPKVSCPVPLWSDANLSHQLHKKPSGPILTSHVTCRVAKIEMSFTISHQSSLWSLYQTCDIRPAWS